MHQAREPARPRAPDLRARRASGAARLNAAPPARRHCVALADVSEDMVAALEHKNPKVKLCTIRLLQARPGPPRHTAKRACGGACERARGAAQACAAGGARAAVAKAHAALVPAAARAAGDAVPDIREAALHALLAFAAKAGSLGALDKVPSQAPRQWRVRSQADGAAAAGVSGGRVRAASGQAGRRAAQAPGGAVGDRARRRRRADHQPDRQGARGRPRSAPPHARPRAAPAARPRPAPP